LDSVKSKYQEYRIRKDVKFQPNDQKQNNKAEKSPNEAKKSSTN